MVGPVRLEPTELFGLNEATFPICPLPRLLLLIYGAPSRIRTYNGFYTTELQSACFSQFAYRRTWRRREDMLPKPVKVPLVFKTKLARLSSSISMVLPLGLEPSSHGLQPRAITQLAQEAYSKVIGSMIL